MTEEKFPPFSTRTRSARARIDNDFPESARIGLFYILQKLVQQNYVDGWRSIVDELQRIYRFEPRERRDRDDWELQVEAENLLLQLQWDNVLDFCQRLHNYLAQDAVETDPSTGQQLLMPKDGVQKYIADELQLLFLEETLGFEFSDGLVRRQGRRHTADQVARAGLVLGDPRLSAARTHYNKALEFFRNATKPDYANTVKEAVSAVEAVAQVLFSSEGTNLDDIIRRIEGSNEGQLPKPIVKTFSGLYGFRNSGKGVAHGTAGAGAGEATKEVAEYVLAVGASQIVLLVDFSAKLEPDVPF